MTRDHGNNLAIPRPITRRTALRAGSAGIAGALGATSLARRALAQDATPTSTPHADQDGLSQEIIEAFTGLPGQQGLKLWAPPDAGRPGWSVALNAERQLFIASAFKVFVLTEYLRQAEVALNPTATESLTAQLNAHLAQELELNESVFSLGSSVFNPPNLTGKVSVRTTLEAMISHSDNTGADMMLKEVGHERVQAFIDEIGLRQTRVPASTREFIGYIFGLADWQKTTWAQLTANDPNATPRPILNDTITMASTPEEMVSFYARALQGEFFRYAETLAVFRAILALADAIPLAMPLGVSAFLKGGSLDFGKDGALSVAGGMYVPDRWVYYSLIINWSGDEAGSSAEVLGAFAGAARTIFTLVRDRLGACE